MANDIKGEKQYLSNVIKKIDSLHEELKSNADSLKSYIMQERGRIWDDFSHGNLDSEQLADLTQITQTEEVDMQRFDDLVMRMEKLKKMRSSPYFAKLVFCEDGEKEDENLYIGYLSLLDDSEVLICDWRADISAMYYDSPLGHTKYSTQYGDIGVELKLRRQFKISDAKLQYMFDSDIAIEDNILQDELGKAADLKLKTIITTIQREQNAIIRDISGDLLVVRGVAGSGKTSIALHRLAYLLYKYRKTLTSGNIVIFSPNKVFNSYIADVLPDLGEDRVVQTDFYSFFKQYLYGCNFSGISEQYEAVYVDKNRAEEAKFKGSEDFARKLEEYFNSRANEIQFRDIYIADSVAVTAQDLEKMYNTEYASYSVEVRKGKIISRVMDDIDSNANLKAKIMFAFEKDFRARAMALGQQYTDDEIENEKKQFWMDTVNRFSADMTEALSIDVYSIYLDALDEFAPADMAKKTRKAAEEGKMNFEDMICCFWLQLVAGQVPAQRKIMHVVVDEAQDYPPMVFMIISKLCSFAKFTILGDTNQSLAAQGCDLKKISSYFKTSKAKEFDLRKSYRSTMEINQFIEQFKTTDEHAEYLARHGEEPRIIASDDKINAIAAQINEWDKAGYKSNAVICRTAKEASEIFDALRNKVPNLLLTESDSVMHSGCNAIIPLYLTKGLEFDGVIVYDADPDTKDENEKQRLYVACSRAMHRLTIIKK